MNNTSNRNHSNRVSSTGLTLSAFILNIGYLYIIPVTCIIGVVFNVLCIVTFASKKLLRNNTDNFMCEIYKYFLFKSVSDLIILMVGTLAPIVVCQFCSTTGSFASVLVGIYFTEFISNFLHTISTLTEIVITLDRLSILDKRILFLRKLPVKYTFPGFVAFSFLMHSLRLFGFGIIQMPNGRFTRFFYDFINQNVYNWAGIIISFVQHSVAFVLIFIINILLFIRFQTYMRKKQRLTRGIGDEAAGGTTDRSTIDSINIWQRTQTSDKQSKSPKAEAKDKAKAKVERAMTRMIIVSSLFFAFCRLMEWISTCLTIYTRLNNVSLTLLASAWLFFAHWLTYITIAINLFIYVGCNKVFREAFFAQFKCDT
jgi:hypothetical protein